MFEDVLNWIVFERQITKYELTVLRLSITESSQNYAIVFIKFIVMVYIGYSP